MNIKSIPVIDIGPLFGKDIVEKKKVGQQIDEVCRKSGFFQISNHGIDINLLKKLSPFTITLTVNLETVYGIILAFLIWRKEEQMTLTFYLGTVMILATIIANAIFKAKVGKR